MEKKILFVAYYAPPSNASGTFRTLGFIRHLTTMGWQVTLLTTKVSTLDEKNNELMQKMPSSVRIIRAANWDLFASWEKLKGNKKEGEGGKKESHERLTAAFSPKSWWSCTKELLTSFLKTPDQQQTGWFWPAAVQCLLFAPKPAIVYSSAPPFTGHLIGVVCKYLWRVPLVCDFRDPWIDNPFRKEKISLVESWDRWLEMLSFAKSDLVVANTEKIASVFRQKQLKGVPKIVAIPNGYDPEDFVGVEPLRNYPDDQLLLVHAGVLYGERNPVNFLKAVQCLAQKKDCPQLRILLIGSSAPIEGVKLEDCIADMGLTSYIQTYPPVSHATALSLMKGADALLLLALGTALQVPAKLFEYFGLEKPVLSIAEPESATEEITCQLPDLVYAAHNAPASIHTMLLALYKAWEEGALRAGQREAARPLLRTMQRQHQAGILEGYLSDLINREKR